MRTPTSLLPKVGIAIALVWCGHSAPIAAQVMNADGSGANDSGVTPASYTTSGSYFNRELGTPLRFSYHSEGYGTEVGVVSLGTMKVFNLDGATWFLDGQGTMSDRFGGGFNAGIGYRELVNMSHGLDPDRILGASFWTDGQSTKSDNFFTQLGFGLESLGESFDLRMNGYFPLERTKESDPELLEFITPVFQEHGLFAGLESITTDTAHSVLDAEFAKRIGNLDAWAIAGVYHLGGGGADDTGYRLGMRGYAIHDLLVGVQVTDDQVYGTNTMATLTWFVGRTHKGNAPVGTIVDRFREPVMRNDFIATTSTTAQTGAVELTDADTNDVFNFIHVNSDAAPGGDGTFENPFNNLADAETAQANGAYIFVHGGSTLAAQDTFTLLDDVKFWGEGTNEFGDVVQHAVDTVERGSVFLPETADNAQDAAAPIINVGAGVDFLVLGDDNNVNNFTINGGQNAITANAVNAPRLANLDINDPTGTGISLTGITGTTVVENTVTITNANRGMLIDGGSAAMNVNARITNAIGSSLVIENRTGNTVSFGGSIQDDNTVAATNHGIVIRDNNNSTIRFTQTINAADDLGISINSGEFRAVSITGNSDNTTIEFADLDVTSAVDATFVDPDPPGANIVGSTIFMSGDGALTINDSGSSLIQSTGTGDAFHYAGGDAIITVNPDITNLGGGQAVTILNHTNNNITFTGDISDTDSNGILLSGNTGGTIAFNGAVDVVNSANAGNGVRITGGGANVTYQFTDINIDLDTGTGFFADGDGTLVITSADGENFIETSGTAIDIDGLAIGAGGAIFDKVTVTNGTGTGIELANIDGAGVLTIGGGTDPADASTLTTANTAITVNNVDNLVMTNVTVDNSGTAGAGLVVTGQNGGNAAFNQLTVTTSGAQAAVNVNANTGGTTNFVDLEATSADGDAIVLNNNNGHIVNINGMTATATGTGRGFAATGQGTLSVTGDTEVNSNEGIAVELDNVTIAAGGAGFDEVNVTAAAMHGVRLNNIAAGGGLLSIGSGDSAGDGGTITSDDDAILINNVDTNVAINHMTIDNELTAGNGLVIQAQNTGTVNVTGLTTTTSTGTGILAQNNTGGTTVYSDADVNVVGAGNGVVLDSNTGATNTFNGLDVNTQGGTGFLATGGGTIGASGTNTITTTTGTGVELDGVTVAAGGFALQSVNVNGAVNGIIARNVDGGQVSVTGTGNTQNSGGTLTTTGDAIILENVTNVDLNNVRVASAGGQALNIDHTMGATSDMDVTIRNLNLDASTGTGIDAVAENNANRFDLRLLDSDIERNVVINSTGSGGFGLLLDNNDIDTAGNDVAFTLGFSGASEDGDVIIRNGNNIIAADAVAFNFTANGTNADVEFRMDNNLVQNSSGTEYAASFLVNGGATVDADIVNNTIRNTVTEDGLRMESEGSLTRINLNLVNNGPTGEDYDLVTTNNGGNFNFGVVSRDAADGNNPADVTFSPAIGDFESIDSVEAPSVPN